MIVFNQCRRNNRCVYTPTIRLYIECVVFNVSRLIYCFLRLLRTELLWLISLLFVLWVVLIMVVISEARFEGHCLQITYFSVIRVPACTIAILLLFFAVILNLVSSLGVFIILKCRLKGFLSISISKHRKYLNINSVV